MQHQFSGAAMITVLRGWMHQKESARPVSKSAANLAQTAAAEAIVAHLKEHADADEAWTVVVELTAAQVRVISTDRREIRVSGGEAPGRATSNLSSLCPRQSRGLLHGRGRSKKSSTGCRGRQRHWARRKNPSGGCRARTHLSLVRRNG